METAATADLKWLYDGYVGSCARFQAVEDADHSLKDTFIPTFEALNWGASFELFMRDELGQPLTEDLVHAFGYVRNRVHHQWAAALKAVVFPLAPVQAPGGRRIVGGYRRWCWKPLEELPAPASRHPDRAGEAAYPGMLAERPVRETLIELQDVFDRHI